MPTDPPAATITWNGTSGSVELDGVDISRAVRSLTLRLNPNDVARLELDVFVMAVDVGHATEPAVKLHMSDEARELLSAQGWTPPEPTDA